MGAFGSKPEQPETVPTDIIIPLAYWNLHPWMETQTVDLNLRFAETLDSQKIHDGLTRLLELEGWRNLGARLRRNKAGRLEYHIPQSYDKDRPGFLLSEQKFDMFIDAHPLGSRMPKKTALPTFYQYPTEFSTILLGNNPKRLAEWLSSDRPQLTFHLVTFRDCSFLTVTWLHTLVDAVGMGFILRALCLVLQGAEDQVPAFHGIDMEPSQPIDELPIGQRYIWHDTAMSIIGVGRFLFWTALDIFKNRSTDQRRVLFLPKASLEGLRHVALQDIKSKSSHEVIEPFLSQSDVLLAWWVKTLVKAMNPRRERQVVVGNAFEYRDLFKDEIMPASSSYIGNAVAPSWTVLLARQILDNPLSTLASTLRESVVRSKTREQTKAVLAFNRNKIDKTGMPGIIGDPNQLFLVCTNWHKAKYFELNFSPAVERSNEVSHIDQRKIGRPVYVQGFGYDDKPLQVRNIGVVFGRDLDGSWWSTWDTGIETWKIVDEELKLLGGTSGSKETV